MEREERAAADEDGVGRVEGWGEEEEEEDEGGREAEIKADK